MDRHPASLDQAAAGVAAADHRPEGRIVAAAIHNAAYLIPGRLDPDSGGDLRRRFAAAVVRDGLALLALAGGGPGDVVAVTVDLDLYHGPDHERSVADRAAARAAADEQPRCYCVRAANGHPRSWHTEADHVTGYVVGPAPELPGAAAVLHRVVDAARGAFTDPE